jgi:tetratricopeptide (TPR) repeat protein
VLCLAGCSCSKSAISTGGRTAILPVENLTGDPSFDWLSAAASTILTGQTRASSGSSIFAIPAIRDAYANNAARVVHAYFTRSVKANTLNFSFSIEDLATHKIRQTIDIQGDPLVALNQFAHVLSPTAQPFATQNAEALRAWGSAEFEKAVELDPGFGQAWLAYVRKLALSGQPAVAERAAERALAQQPLRSDFERYEIAAALAEVRKDFKARAKAMEALAALTPRDIPTLMSAAQANTLARNFDEASALYRKVSAIDPGNFAAMNALGYSEAMAGRLDSAKQAFEIYAKQQGQAVNALDSLGEAYFMNGKFEEAAEYFRQTNSRDPKFAGGRTLLKQAYAAWLSGKTSEADHIFDGYAVTHDDGTSPLMHACWQYSTGREAQARAELARGPADVATERQLALWDAVRRATPPDANRLAQLKSAYETSMPPHDAQARTFYAAALLSVGRVDEAKILLRQWPLPVDGDPIAACLVYPEFLAARRKAGL